jgi:L-lysine 6-oxidase
VASFDLRDNSPENKSNRKNYLEYFRKSGEEYSGIDGQAGQLFSNDDYLKGIPMMPNNAGSNAVDNSVLDKFVELSRTQYYFLEQWAEGKFTTGASKDILGLLEIDHADVGNCVGAPLCPGVEVTWSIKNPAIYESPYRIKHKNKDPEFGFDLIYYDKIGLDPDWDETAPKGELGGGCEPGDLTKRMADPWVSDLFECNINHINFTDADRNATAGYGLEEPPTYLAYWWPPQSPWDVILGVSDPEELDPRKRKEKVISELTAAGASSGEQVNFIRGIHNHIEMVYAWSYLGFIVNQNEGEDREDYPYFVEKERNHEEFEVSAVSVANKRNTVDPFGVRFEQGYHLKKDLIEFRNDEQ